VSATISHETAQATPALAEDSADVAVADVERVAAQVARAANAVENVIYGQRTVVEECLMTVLAGGHALLIGVPGLAKTRLVQTLGGVLGLNDKRVQFTPDLMPADILGSEVLDQDDHGKRSFRFLPGPVFCQLLMADEINRASPRTQSALLQAMQERQVSVAGQYHTLPKPFHVLATQNPVEQEGTYPLPEAQLDRFLMQIDIHYPDEKAEREIMLRTTGTDDATAPKVMTTNDLLAAQKLVRQIPVGESVVNAILRLVRAGRPETSPIEDVKKNVLWGPGPRASQALMLASRARALLQGRLSPSIDDVLALAKPVLQHRMALSFSARADGKSINDVIAKLCDYANHS
jgi:MoxR-like ATPase